MEQGLLRGAAMGMHSSSPTLWSAHLKGQYWWPGSVLESRGGSILARAEDIHDAAMEKDGRKGVVRSRLAITRNRSVLDFSRQALDGV
jgi:hypothetical protein